MVDVALVTSAVRLLGLAVNGYKLDRAQGRKPLWRLHIMNVAVGMAAIAWVFTTTYDEIAVGGRKRLGTSPGMCRGREASARRKRPSDQT